MAYEPWPRHDEAWLRQETVKVVVQIGGKKRAVLHVTGFSTNMGVLGCLLTPSDYVLCDRENHASIFAGLGSTKKMGTFVHNDAGSAARKIAEGETGDLGDTSTLADPAVVDELVAGRVA